MNRHFGALQGLAILLVVFNHSVTLALDCERLGILPPAVGWQHYLLVVFGKLGILAVPTFLFISGCFFSYAARGNNPPMLSWKVVRAGLKHLLWPYLIWSIAFYIWIFFRWNTEYTFFGYLKLLVRGYPFHFIPLIAIFYILSPILVRFARRFGLLFIIAIGLYQLILINIRFPGVLGTTFPTWTRFLAPPILHDTLYLWAIYFPLGLVYGINSGAMLPGLKKARWVFLTATIVCFVLSLLDILSIWQFPLAEFICPLMFVLFIPTMSRNSIPMVRKLEKVGKKSYGLYLTNLLILDAILLGVLLFVPGLFNQPVLLVSILFALTLGGSLMVMNRMIRLPARPMYRYVFG